MIPFVIRSTTCAAVTLRWYAESDERETHTFVIPKNPSPRGDAIFFSDCIAFTPSINSCNRTINRQISNMMGIESTSCASKMTHICKPEQARRSFSTPISPDGEKMRLGLTLLRLPSTELKSRVTRSFCARSHGIFPFACCIMITSGSSTLDNRLFAAASPAVYCSRCFMALGVKFSFGRVSSARCHASTLRCGSFRPCRGIRRLAT